MWSAKEMCCKCFYTLLLFKLGKKYIFVLGRCNADHWTFSLCSTLYPLLFLWSKKCYAGFSRWARASYLWWRHTFATYLKAAWSATATGAAWLKDTWKVSESNLDPAGDTWKVSLPEFCLRVILWKLKMTRVRGGKIQSEICFHQKCLPLWDSTIQAQVATQKDSSAFRTKIKLHVKRPTVELVGEEREFKMQKNPRWYGMLWAELGCRWRQRLVVTR